MGGQVAPGEWLRREYVFSSKPREICSVPRYGSPRDRIRPARLDDRLSAGTPLFVLDIRPETE